MYSYEIENLLKIKKYILTSEEYINLCENSKQIKSIIYKPFEDKFYITTDDNYNFDFKIDREKTR